MSRSLQNITNYFIVSLAVADLCVAGVVMPFYAYTMVNIFICTYGSQRNMHFSMINEIGKFSS